MLSRKYGVFSIILVAVFILTAAGCGGGNGGVGESAAQAESTEPGEPTANAADTGSEVYVYAASERALPDGVSSVELIFSGENGVCLIGRNPANMPVLCAMDENCENPVVTNLNADVNQTLSNFTVDPGGSVYVLSLNAESQPCVMKIDIAENRADEIILSSWTPEQAFYALAVDASGYIYISVAGSLWAFDANGASAFSMEDPDISGALAVTRAGTVACLIADRGNRIAVMDPEQMGFGDSYTVSDGANTLLSSTQYDICYIGSYTLYGFDFAAEASTAVVNLLDLDVDSLSLNGIHMMEDGKILLYDRGSGLLLVEKKPASDVSRKTVLTLAAIDPNMRLQQAVIDFNRENDAYRILLVDYTDAGVDKLYTEIIAGDIPDILSLTGLPYKTLARKGLFEDLYPFLDEDSELERSDILSSVLEASEVDGGLYRVFPAFSVLTLVGAADTLGAEFVWDIGDFSPLVEKLKAGDLYFDMSKQEFLYYSCFFMLDGLIDWETGSCSFDSDAFISLLDFINTFPDTYTPISGDALALESVLTLAEVYEFTSVQYYRALFGSDIRFVGFPAPEGAGYAVIPAPFHTNLAMSSQSKYKEVVWQFLRTFWTEDYQLENFATLCFPTNARVMETAIADAMEKDESVDDGGNVVEMPKGQMNDVTIYAATQEEIDRVMALIDSADRLYGADENITDIILEEADAFFAGEKTAAETAALIQSRVQLYVYEQS